MTDAPRSPTRRRWMIGGGVALLGAAAAWPLSTLLTELDEDRAPWRPGPYGPMRPDPAGVLDLPEGFSYRVIDRAGSRMSDGLVVPARCDGMGVFATAPGELVLMRNHEIPTGLHWMGPGASSSIPNVYDAASPGGVTRVVLDAATLERRSSNLVLAGTSLNCCGGAAPSPYGWLSCEETVEARHGYAFACDPLAERAAPPRPIPAMGRFRHEAACVDVTTGCVFLTEDREDGGLYRFTPHDASTPFDGALHALAVVGRDRCDVGALARGETVEIRWVPIHAPDPDDDTVRREAQAAGAALVRRGEGIVRDPSRPGSMVVSATVGGPAALGQLLRLDPEAEGGTLTVLTASTGRTHFDMPDNLAVSPSGLVFFCEDGSGRNFLRGVDRDARVFDFARNALSRSELAGVSFSPDARAMFVNLQVDGLTLAITGPFEQA